MIDFAKCLHRDDRGAAFIEYTALLGVIMAVGLGTLAAVGGWINSVWLDTCSALKIDC